MRGLPGWHGAGEAFEHAHGSLYFETEGSGPLVILAGGGPGNDHSHYHPWFSALAKSHTVVYYDHPGTGRSQPISSSAAYSVGAYSGAIEALREHFGAESMSLLGISFGGLPAVDYALNFPHRLDSLVLSNAQASASSWQEGNIDSINNALQRHFPERWEEIQALRRRGVLSLDTRYQELVEMAVPYLEWAHRDHAELVKSDVGFVVHAYEAFVGDDPEWTINGSLAGYEPDISVIETRTLILAGRYDGLTLPSLAKRCADRLSNSELVILEESAHRPWAEEPVAYFDVLRSFLMARDR